MASKLCRRKSICILLRRRSFPGAEGKGYYCSLSTDSPISDESFIRHPSHYHLSSIKSKDELLKSYTITPPIKPWPQNLHPKRLIYMITQQQNLDLSLQIFEYAGNYHPNYRHTYETYHSIIQKLGRARAFEPVESLLKKLLHSDIVCGEDLFITVIRSYGFAGRSKDSFRTFLRIKDFGVQHSVRSFNTLMNILVQNKQLELVHSVFKNCHKKFGIIPNIFTCNILLKALCKMDDIQRAIQVIDEMPGMGLIPNVASYTTILGGFVFRGDMDNAQKVFDEMLDRRWIPDTITYTVLMDGYCRQGKLLEAVKLMDDMDANDVQINDVTYGVIIEAYCKEKKPVEALKLLADMLEKKYIPNSTLCCKVIDVLCKEGKVEEACDLWKKLLRKNCTPDNAISATLIHWLCKKGKIWEARKIFDEFDKSSIPTVLTYNSLIFGLCEAGELCEAGRLWDNMVEKGCFPNSYTFNLLISGFCKVGSPKEGVRILEEMLEKGCKPDKSTYSILIDGLFKSGMENEAVDMLSMAAASSSSSSVGVGIDSWTLSVNLFVKNLDDTINILDEVLRDNQFNVIST